MKCGFSGCLVCMTGAVTAQANFAVAVTTRVPPLARQTVGLQAENTFNTGRRIKDPIIVVLKTTSGGHTSALLMNCSVAFFSFSLCPLQALSADACRARPKEKVKIQGLARGQLLMALRWIDASSSLWPPERKATPAQNRKYFVYMNSIHMSEKIFSRCDSWQAHL